jgi:hypothetical protein
MRIGKIVHTYVQFAPTSAVTKFSGIPIPDTNTATRIGAGLTHRDTTTGGVNYGEYYFDFDSSANIYIVVHGLQASHSYAVEFTYMAD